MADLAKTVGIIFKAQDQAGAVTGKIADDLKTIGAAGGDSARKVDELAKSTEALSNKESSVLSLTNAMKALAASLVFKAFVDANVEAEKFERAMTLLKGSTEAAGKEFQYISGVSKTLGLDLFSAADAYTQLTAATKGTALEGAQTRAIFEAVSTAMSSLGKSSADTQGALLAISQIVSKGNVSMEELRGQLGERLPGAFQIAAKSMGLTTQELDDLVSSGKLTAEEFLPKFAAALKDTFGDTKFVDGYAAAMNRLQNAVADAFLELGKSGAFDALTKTVEVATVAIVGAVSGLRLLAESVGIVAGALATGNFSNVPDALTTAYDKAAKSTEGARDALGKWNDEAGRTGTEAASATDGVNLFAGDVAKLAAETAKTDDALKALGVSSKKVNADLVTAFETVASSATATGNQIVAGFGAALKKATSLDDIDRLRTALVKAKLEGKITADQFTASVIDLGKANDKLVDPTGKATKAVADQAKETRDATKAANDFAVQMAAIASNERIKFFEAKISLDIANVQANAQKVIAAFESINNSITSTGDVLGKLFGLFSSLDTLDSSARNLLFQQIDKENALRQQSFDLQKSLTEAQIQSLEATTRALTGGDALIKIDGAGLQPQLEAFMWEILKSIQTRVNRDGLKLLLGV